MMEFVVKSAKIYDTEALNRGLKYALFPPPQGAQRRALSAYSEPRKLLATMTVEQRKLFNRYTDIVPVSQTMTKYLLFQNSFKQEARMTLENIEE